MTAAVGTDIDIRRVDAPVGAEVVGVDLSKELDEPTFNRIREAYYQHSVIVFRDQH
jgi:taurine dioxygenase